MSLRLWCLASAGTAIRHNVTEMLIELTAIALSVRHVIR